jgi:hypothetical protein
MVYVKKNQNAEDHPIQMRRPSEMAFCDEKATVNGVYDGSVNLWCPMAYNFCP